MSIGKRKLVFQEQNDGSFRISSDTDLKLGTNTEHQEVKLLGHNLQSYVGLQNEISLYKRKYYQCLKQLQEVHKLCLTTLRLVDHALNTTDMMPLMVNKPPINLRDDNMIKECGKELIDNHQAVDNNNNQVATAATKTTVNPNGRKRFRTKFSQDQKEKRFAFAEKLGWKMQKRDEEMVNEFCNEVGIGKRVLKAWMRNNKHVSAKREIANNNISSRSSVDNIHNHSHGVGLHSDTTSPPVATANGSSSSS